jgi:hypothetical protein
MGRVEGVLTNSIGTDLIGAPDRKFELEGNPILKNALGKFLRIFGSQMLGVVFKSRILAMTSLI